MMDDVGEEGKLATRLGKVVILYCGLVAEHCCCSRRVRQ